MNDTTKGLLFFIAVLCAVIGVLVASATYNNSHFIMNEDGSAYVIYEKQIYPVCLFPDEEIK